MSYEELIKEICLSDDRMVVVTAENRALIRNLPPILGNRFIDVGITEQNMIGMCAGLALRGRKPVCHALATFLTLRAFEFIRTDVGISGLPVKITSFVPGFLSDGNGPTHQAIEDVSLMRGIPGMDVFCPANNEDMLLMLRDIWATERPAYVRATTRPAAEGYQHTSFQIGKAEVVAQGKDITILTYGFMFENSYFAYLKLKEMGYDVGLVNLRSLSPIDEEVILDVARNSARLVTIEDHFHIGGLYSILSEIFLKNRISPDVMPIDLQDRWYKPGLLTEVLAYEGFTPEQLVERILNDNKFTRPDHVVTEHVFGAVLE